MRLARITAIDPGSVHGVEELQAYFHCGKAHHWGSSHDTRFLDWLIERAVHALTARRATIPLLATPEAGMPPVLDRGLREVKAWGDSGARVRIG